MDLGIKNKVALVTGASAGLGLAAAVSLAKEGVRVAINSRSLDNLKSAAETIEKETGINPILVEGDLSIDSIPEKIVAKVISKMGSIDILVNNAGGPPPGLFQQHTLETWKKSADLTLFSAIEVTRAVVPYMMKAKWGRIIFITSVAVKQPIDNLIISNCLRAGVTGFAKSISSEFAGHGITVNTVCPGYTDTERLKSLGENLANAQGCDIKDIYKKWTSNIPMGRVGRPEELASLITFMASERASYITGASIPVDGGYYKGLL
jgi:3-oxoacyl-[acyl-carrier protein] reductase